MATSQRVQELKEQGDHLFSNRGSLESLWQDIADNFCPERATFTTDRTVGDDFASHLMTGFPALALRELTNSLSGMLRPKTKQWGKLRAKREQINQSTEAKKWLEWATNLQFVAMYDRAANFVRACKEGDRDFVAFGQTVIEASLNNYHDGLLYRTWHLRDVAWCENAEQQIDVVHRKCKYEARQLAQKFPGKVHASVRRAAENEPYKEIECRHITIPSADYDYNGGRRRNQPFTKIYIDIENDELMEEIGAPRLGYIIPRWDLGSFGVYATSPATMLALPDSRLIQTMMTSILEAGEMATNPPMIATQEAIRSDIQLFARGITWADQQYDERKGDVLRPIDFTLDGVSHGMRILEDVRNTISQTFYLNKLTLPELSDRMTAYEVQKRIEEYVRSALPLFEPMESEYNGQIMEETFMILLENNAFGGPDNMPQILKGQDVEFAFESPLQDTIAHTKLEAFRQAAGLTEIGVQVDPSIPMRINWPKAYDEALAGAQVPADWMRTPEELEAIAQQQAQAAKGPQQLQQINALAQTGKNIGEAGQALAGTPEQLQQLQQAMQPPA